MAPLLMQNREGAMDREQMLRVIGEGYAARVRGDVEGVLGVFTSDAKFNLNAAPQKAPVSLQTEDTRSLRQAMTQLVQTFEFQKLDILEAVVEGSKAAIRIRFTVRSKETGHTAETESLDLVEFRDGKVSSYTQFFDTAMAEKLMTPAVMGDGIKAAAPGVGSGGAMNELSTG
jgi:ketosteroid isomerase-like protein